MTAPTQRPGPFAGEPFGIVMGIAAASMWTAFLIVSRQGAVEGIPPVDMITLRFTVAALVLAPVVLWLGRRTTDAAALTPGRVLALVLAAGPLFVLLNVGGFQFAPLAHGGVLQPSTVGLVGMALAALWLKERVGAAQMLGAGLIVIGIAAIAGGGLLDAGTAYILGDAMFVTAGLFWVGYTLLLKRWRLSGLHAAAAVSVVSALVMAPVATYAGVWTRLASMPVEDLALQVLAHGLFAGAGAMVAFGLAVERLGAGRAALFPALVPALTLLVGLPLTGERPSALELAGALIACLGLLAALRRPTTDRPFLAPRNLRPARGV